jgi:hypothetical protein
MAWIRRRSTSGSPTIKCGNVGLALVRCRGCFVQILYRDDFRYGGVPSFDKLCAFDKWKPYDWGERLSFVKSSLIVCSMFGQYLTTLDVVAFHYVDQ